MATKIW